MSANPALRRDAQKIQHRQIHAASLRAVLIDNALLGRSMQQPAFEMPPQTPSERGDVTTPP
jgi:hypothetical protein